MKRITTITVMLMGFGLVAASAQGFGPQFLGTTGATEEQELSGRLQLAENEIPVLQAGGEEYLLHLHPTLASEIDVRNGQQVTVEGWVHEAASRDLLGTDQHLRVTAMEVDGNRVVLSEPARRHGMRGQGPQTEMNGRSNNTWNRRR